MNFSHILFSFNGRINRGKFWLGVLLPSAALVIFAIVVSLVLGPLVIEVPAVGGKPATTLINFKSAVPVGIAYLGLLWTSLAVGVKRFHDRGKSGWWVLIVLVPVIGGLWYLIELGILEGNKGPNTYGPDPLEGRRG
ncbi:MAG: DUF805 domain-containing protein [Hyphomicrobiaceae bacterium]|nr:MAG: DUF805 domain-containing protein [Hyphomicrobiaceae bacterium]